ncbi:hypothetical protein HDV00_005903 [Rhizophlyctis rosea]|nr:hypothetical protein HDV00_005903 [Rhizophlyctis rosea]
MKATLIAAARRSSPYASFAKNLTHRTPTDPSPLQPDRTVLTEKYLDQHNQLEPAVKSDALAATRNNMHVPGKLGEYFLPARIKVRQEGSEPLILRCSICGSNQHLDHKCPEAPKLPKGAGKIQKLPALAEQPQLTAAEKLTYRDKALREKLRRIVTDIIALHPEPEAVWMNKWEIAKVTLTRSNKICNLYWRRLMTGSEIKTEELNANLQPLCPVIQSAIVRRIGKKFDKVTIQELPAETTRLLLQRVYRELYETEGIRDVPLANQKKGAALRVVRKDGVETL